ncbi:MAG: RNA polymerase sigma factor [Bacteroidales bacterium]
MTEREYNRYLRKSRQKLLCFAEMFVTRGALTPEDMVQEASIKVWRQISQDKTREIRNLDAFIYVVLKNVCLDFLKSKNNNLNFVDSIDENRRENNGEESNEISGIKKQFQRQNAVDPDIVADRKEKVSQIKTIIDHLPKDQQIVVKLRDIIGYELDEIADTLNMTQGNVRTILSRGRKAIRQQMFSETNI